MSSDAVRDEESTPSSPKWEKATEEADDYYSSLFLNIGDFYRKKVFCDVAVLAGVGDFENLEKAVKCHSLVLSAFVPSLKNLLKMAEFDERVGCYVLHFPDIDETVMANFIDNIYDVIRLGRTDLELEIDANLAEVLGLTAGIDYDQEEAVPPGVVAVPRTETGQVDYDKFNRNAHLVRTVKMLNNGAENASMSLRDVEEYSKLTPDPDPAVYNMNVSTDQTLNRMDAVVVGFSRGQGTFRATTMPYYATKSVVEDDENILLTEEGSAKQFRMRLPDSTFVSLVAVGVRDGVNVAHVLTLKSKPEKSRPFSWADETSMVNIVNAAKNICGTSFGVILRHPRISEANKEKISRESVDRYKTSLRHLSKIEKTSIATQCQKYLKEFDADSPKLNLEHLPQQERLMEFSLVRHLRHSEISDYAIVYGDHPGKLVIRSLFHLKYQTLSDIRIITILLDALSCFLGFGNAQRVTKLKALQETFDNYAMKTCQNLAVQELGIHAVDVKGQLNELSAKAIMADDAHFSIKSGTTRDLEKVLNLPPRKIRKPDVVPDTIKCDLCDKSFDGFRILNQHLNEVHADMSHAEDDQNVPKSCLLCSRLVRSDEDMKKHMRNFHKSCKCRTCHEEFSGLCLLQAHYSKVHSQTFKCDVCGYVCRGRGKMKNHKINKHMEEHEKPYVCSVCGKGFAEKAKLKSHQMNVHIRSRPYKCRMDGCSSDFNELANRNAHERMVHKYDYRKQVQLQ